MASAASGAGVGPAKMSDALVVFMPSGKRGRFPKGTPVLQAARALGVDIDSVCGGRAICGRCQVRVGEGQFAKHGITSSANHLENLTRIEVRFSERKGLAADRRLSCQARLFNDVVIDVPPESQVHRQVVRKRAEARAIEVDPILHPYYIEVEEPDMFRARGDLERVEEALKTQWGLGDVTCRPSQVLHGLQTALQRRKIGG